MAVVLFNFASGAEPLTPAEVNERVFTGERSASAFFAEESAGRLTVVGNVYGWFTIDGQCNCKDMSGCLAVAKTKLGSAAAQYDGFVYGYVGSCGSGSTGDGTAWVALGSGVRWNIFAHEMSHAFGLQHSGGKIWVGEDGRAVPIGGECAVADLCYPGGRCPYGVTCIEQSCCRWMESGDPVDILGDIGAGRHSNVWQLLRLGVLSALEFPAGNVLTVGCEGDYLVAPTHTLLGSHGVVVRIPRTRSSGAAEYLYLELRQPTGLFDDFVSTDPMVSGPTIRVAPDACAPGALAPTLLDPTVDGDSADDFRDAVLPVGQTFVDPEGGIEITTLAVTAEGALVHIKPGTLDDPDHDGVCTDTDPCTTLVDGQTAWQRPRLDVRLGRNDALSLQGRFEPADGAADPARDGARVLVRSVSGATLLDTSLPGGTTWRESSNGMQYRYDGRLPIGTARMKLRRRAAAFDVSFSLQRSTLPDGPIDLPLVATVVLGGADAARAGRCGEFAFAHCESDRTGTRIACR